MPKPWLPPDPNSPVFDKLDEIDEAFPAEADDIAYLWERVQQKEYKIPMLLGCLAMIQAIDPATGDSVLHDVARDGSYSGYLDILRDFDHPRLRWHKWAEHALVTHQNHAGDTILHVAAQHGHQHLLTTIYRKFQANHWTTDFPEKTTFEGVSAPEQRQYPDDFEDLGSNPSLRFIIMTNAQGNTPEDEAQLAGQHDIARWFRDIVERLDPEHDRTTEAEKAILDRVVSQKYHYKEMTGEDYHC